MSGSMPNPFYTSPTWGRGFSNLAQVFMPNPEAEALAARGELFAAQAENARLEGQQRARGLEGVAAAQERLRAGLGADPAATWRDIFAGLLANPQTFDAFRQGAGVIAATQGVPEADLGRIVVGGGGNWRNTEGGARFAEGEATRRTGITADATVRAEGLRQGGANARWSQVLSPGQVAVLPPNSPGAPSGSEGPVRVEGNTRPQTLDAARAALVQPFVEGAFPPDQAGRAREIIAPSIVRQETANAGRIEQIRLQGQQGMELQELRGAQAAGRLDVRGQQRLQELELQNAGGLERAQTMAGALRPPAVDGGDITAIDSQIGAQLPSGTALDGAGAAWVRNRAALLMQQQGPTFNNIPLAVQQALRDYMAAEPPRVDNRLNPFSDRRLGAPAPAQAAPQQGGYRLPNGQVIPEGATIRQNGQTFIIRNGQPVPGA